MAVRTTVKSIQDIMRQDAGVDGDAQRISQLAWMIFLKLFSDKEQEYELLEADYQSPLPDRLRWAAWAADRWLGTHDAFATAVDKNERPIKVTILPGA